MSPFPYELVCLVSSYFGGRSDANAARTVFRATPSNRAISLIGTPQGQYSRVVDMNDQFWRPATDWSFSTVLCHGGTKPGLAHQ